MSLHDTITSSPLQAVAVIIAAIGVIIAIMVFLKNRKIKSLIYIIRTNTPLLTVGEEIRGKIKIIFKEKPIEDLTLLIIQIFNNGNLPIKQDDFEEAINIALESTVEVLSAEIISTKPPGLKKHAKLNYSHNNAVLEPLLLNGKDSITIKLLCTGFNDAKKIVVDARIVDISEIKEESENIEAFELLIPLIGLRLNVSNAAKKVIIYLLLYSIVMSLVYLKPLILIILSFTVDSLHESFESLLRVSKNLSIVMFIYY